MLLGLWFPSLLHNGVKRKKRIICASAILLVGISAFYYWFPAWQRYAPRCPIKMLTGLDCPTCGSQRAMYYFLHFRWKEAVVMNPFGIFLCACVALCFGLKACKVKASYTIFSYIVIFGYIIWFIVRNIYHI